MNRGDVIRRLFVQVYLSARDPGHSFRLGNITRGEPRTTVWRLLKDLVDAGVLQRIGKRYAVTPGFREEIAKKLRT